MPAKKKIEIDLAVDDLISTPEVAEEVVQELSFEQAEIESLRKQLEEAKAETEKLKNHPVDADGRPLPDSQLTPQQLLAREAQNREALQMGKELDNIPLEYENVSEGILIHVLEDGLTTNGQVFYVGQEILFGPRAFEETKNRYGQSWLDMSEEDQLDRWGSVKFRKGPWPGKKTYDDAALSNKSIRVEAPTIRL